MESHNSLTGPQWEPFKSYGFTHPFWTINTETVIQGCIVTGIIIAFCLFSYFIFQKKNSLCRFAILQYVDGFRDLLMQSLNACPLDHLAFIGSLFTFILTCNTLSIFPTLEEPTKDLNTTLALGLISFFYVQGNAIRYNGIKAYLAEYLEPFSVMLPLNVMGTLTSIISLSFRLFGNIFGGYTISSLYYQMLSYSVWYECAGLFTGTNLLILGVFTLFEGFIQAFVFSMLSLTFLSMEIVSEEDGSEGAQQS